MVLVSQATRTNGAGNTKLVSATTDHGQHLMSVIEVAEPDKDEVSQKLDALMKMMADLSGELGSCPTESRPLKTTRERGRRHPLATRPPLALSEGGPSTRGHQTRIQMWPNRCTAMLPNR